MQLRIPERLRKGDCIGIVAPGSPVLSPEKIYRGVNYLEKLGYKIKLGKSVECQLNHPQSNIISQTIPPQINKLRSTPPTGEYELQIAINGRRAKSHGYLAASDRTRADEINTLFADKDVQAIFCTRGGYGSPRILSILDYTLIRKNPKIFVGYSDITALHLAFLKKCRMITFAGPMLAVEMQSKMDTYTEEHFWNVLTRPSEIFSIHAPRENPMSHIVEGAAEGILLGGNLSMLLSLFGTQFLPRFDDAILFIEDVGEKVYRIDRMFAQLKNAGVLENVNGILLGNFSEITKEEPSLELDEVIRHYFSSLNKPVIINFPFGHAVPKATLAMGARVRMNARTHSVKIIQRVVL